MSLTGLVHWAVPGKPGSTVQVTIRGTAWPRELQRTLHADGIHPLPSDVTSL